MTRRIALAILVTCWLVLLGGGTASYVAIRRALLEELDASLVLRASSLPEVLGVSAGQTQHSLPSGDRYIIRNALGQTLARPGPSGAPPRPAQVRAKTFAELADGTRIRSVTVAFPGSGGGSVRGGGEMTVLYSGSADRFDRLINRLWLILGTVGVAAGVVTAGAALAVARSALRPLTAAANTIASIDEATLDRRVEVGRLPEELRPMAERLNQMLERLGQGFRQRKQFMADAAHELRTPVSALMASMEVALRRPRDAAALARTLQDCVGDVRILRRLVEALLEQFRADAAAPSTQFAEVNVAAVLDLCVDSASSLARQKAVDIRRSYRRDLRAITHSQRLRSIVANLLDNAVEYNPPGGSAEVACDVTATELTLAVRDAGHGIPSELLPHVFEPFFRGHHEGVSENGHCGLGLYLVKSHVDALGGTCVVQSAPGKGTEFRISLPNRSIEAPNVAVTSTPARRDPVKAAKLAATCGVLTAISSASVTMTVGGVI